MKNLLTILAFILLFTACSKKDDDIKPKNPTFALPPETQIGANTFGVTIKGKVYIPRDPTGVSVGPTSNAMIWWAAPGNNNEFNELEIKDGASEAGFNMIIHLQDFNTIGVGKYILKQSNFQDNIDSISDNHIYFKIWDSNIINYAYYGSVENLGEINITRRSNGIISGNFKGKFVRNDNLNDIILITDGRFDFGPYLYYTKFP